jgi:2-octaprenyl-6-methoxyphenol hydroxylase
MPDPDFDVAILGAGPVGCALALALRGSGLRIALIGGGPEPLPKDSPPPFRPLALSYASRIILERIDAWDGLATTPIEQIHVSQAGGFGRTKISGAELGLPALGYVADYGRIAAHLAQRVDSAIRMPVKDEPPCARLIVHAEGLSQGQATEKDYGHTAIVAAVECESPAHGVAWERFTAEGPLALLPFEGRYGLVWSRTNASASALMASGDREFLGALQTAFGGRAGTFISIGARSATPLFLRYRTGPCVAGEVHIGNAAQTLHPVAGQGLNLGLRDAWDLAVRVRASARDALGAASVTEQFARARHNDARMTIRATDLMATLYVRRDPLSAALRGMALTALDVFPPARKAFARRMIYGLSAW